MGQKVNPTGFRTGITIGWKSRWFAPKSNFGEFLVEDEKIRKFVDQRLNRQPPYAAVSTVEIDRTREEVKVSLRTGRPGLVIGPKGAEVEKLKEALEDLTDRRVNINIIEIRNPDLEANLVAEGIAEQIKRRASFRRVIKQRADACMQAGAKGIKITVAGRIGGAEIARSETQVRGSVPLHTLEADVDYGFALAITTYGCIGIKVWVFRGMFGEEAATADTQQQQAAMTRARRRYQQRDAGPDGGGQGAPRQGAAKPSAPSAAVVTPPPAVETPKDTGADTTDSTE
ncbi:MAG: 30S ribosomal protein S3 [Phycisphaerales bacterium]|jgi:small subunit ribosomal protein S3|nr:30S ribosomal protein S3 [Phycisphaerales bacterium]